MTSTAHALAHVLEGSWRLDPPPAPALGEACLEVLAPLLAGSGAGALAWRRLRRGSGADHAGGQMLRHTHVQQALEARLQEREIENYLRLLAEHGVEPLLVKGWAAARLYPEPGLRPFGDVDLVVRPAQGALAASVLGVPVDSDEIRASVDLKTSLRSLYGLPLDEALAWSQRVPLGAAHVRVLSHEHHLRMLCLHFLRHGAWRPLWLCDIAAALEARSPGFSWSRCLGSDARRADYVAGALGLAHRLLGARVDGTPVERSARDLAPWVIEAALRAWEAPMTSQHQPHPLFSRVPRRPAPLLRALLLRWPNPVEAAVARSAPLDAHPLASQALCYGRSCFHFLRSRRRPQSAAPPRSTP